MKMASYKLILRDGKYIESEMIPTFPNLQIVEAISQFVQQSITMGESATLRAFRKWVREQINK